MTSLITGGAGFIGSYLAEILLKNDNKVVILDNLSTGRKDNIVNLLDKKNLTLRKGSVLNKRLVNSLVKEAHEIYHLAAAVGVKTIMQKPLESMILNIKGAEIILEAAEKRKLPILIVSTSEIYGKNGKIPFNEKDDRVYGSVYNYRWGYAFSKGVDEFLGLAYFREKGLPVRIVRLFNVIGPRQTGEYGMVVPRFIDMALNNNPITVYGNGQQTRCFADVRDVIEALMKIMKHPKTAGEIYNLGNDKEITINQLAEKIISLTNSKSRIKYIPYEKAYGDGFEDMQRRKPDLTKIKKLINYKARHDLDETLLSIINSLSP